MISGSNPLLAAWNTMANLLQAILEITNMTRANFQEFYDVHKKLAETVIQKNPVCLQDIDIHINSAKDIILERLGKIAAIPGMNA
jgi:hypothetical protein